MMMTTTIEDLAKLLTPDVVESYEAAENKTQFVSKFCAEKYHTKSPGFTLLVDRLLANSREAIVAHGLIVPVDDGE